MSEEAQYQPPQAPPPRGRSDSCLVYGCLIVVALFIAGIVAILVGGYFFYSNLVNTYTEAEPRSLPPVMMSEEEYQPVAERYDQWREAIRQGGQEVSITLTEEEINALIQYHPDMEAARGNVRVTMEGETIGGIVSIPIPDSWPVAGGRYLNGEATLRVSVTPEQGAAAYLESLEVAGNDVPQEIMGDMTNQNMLQNAANDPEMAQLLQQVKRLSVENSQLTIVASGPAQPDAADQGTVPASQAPLDESEAPGPENGDTGAESADGGNGAGPSAAAPEEQEAAPAAEGQ